MKKVLFSDLDGTLLDLNSYSFNKSIDAVKSVQNAKIPIVFCSSKTRMEQEFYRKKFGVKHPFIVENGSAIFIPRAYFKSKIPFNTYLTEDYEVIQLGDPVSQIRHEIQKLRGELDLDFQCYFDLPPEEVSLFTALNLSEAKRAMLREFSETILNGRVNDSFLRRLKRRGFSSIPGSKFHTIVSKNADKGKAIQILLDIYQREWGEVESIGVGDSQNDLEMFKAVNDPYIVQRPDGQWTDLKDDSIKKVSGVGPEGWALAAEIILSA